MIRGALLLALGTSCVHVADTYTCTSDAQCTGAAQGRCEPSGSCSFPDATCGTDGYRYDASSGVRAGVCVLADEVVQADLDFTHASDQVASNCSTGTADIELELSIASQQTIAFDTPGAGATIAVYAGSCPPATPSAGMCTDMPCNDPTYDRNVQTLDPGTYCIVAEQTGATTGTLRMFPIDGTAIVATAATGNGSTCGHATNVATPSCFSPVGPSVPVLLWHCPSMQLQFAATITPEASLDVGLSLRRATDNSEVGGYCANAGGNGANEMLHGTILSPGPYWLMIDGVGGGGAGQCGAFATTFSFQ